MNLGLPEMIFIFLLALIIFGPKKLPEIGRQIGKAMNEFKRASNEFKSQIEGEIRNLEIEEALKKDTTPQILPPQGSVATTAEVADAPSVFSAPPESAPPADGEINPAATPESGTNSAATPETLGTNSAGTEEVGGTHSAEASAVEAAHKAKAADV